MLFFILTLLFWTCRMLYRRDRSLWTTMVRFHIWYLVFMINVFFVFFKTLILNVCLQCFLDLRWRWTSPPSCIMKTHWQGRSQQSERLSLTIVVLFIKNTKIILFLFFSDIFMGSPSVGWCLWHIFTYSMASIDVMNTMKWWVAH